MEYKLCCSLICSVVTLLVKYWLFTFSKVNIVILMCFHISMHKYAFFLFCHLKYFCMFLCGGVITYARMAKDEMGRDGHQVPDQTIQRLAASHPHRQHRHRLHRGMLHSINSLLELLHTNDLFLAWSVFKHYHSMIYLFFSCIYKERTLKCNSQTSTMHVLCELYIYTTKWKVYNMCLCLFHHSTKQVRRGQWWELLCPRSPCWPTVKPWHRPVTTVKVRARCFK